MPSPPTHPLWADHPDSETAADTVATAIAEAIEAVPPSRPAVIALSGGTTPAPAYRRLAAMPLDWGRVIVLPADERFTAQDDPLSNAGMIARMFAGLPVRLVPLAGPGPYTQEMIAAAAAAACERVAAALAEAEGRLDFVLLGMGTDGHVLSWFPGAQGLAAALNPAGRDPVSAILAPQAAPPLRLTLTYPAIAAARAGALFTAGAAKRALLEDDAGLPIAQARRALAGRLQIHHALSG